MANNNGASIANAINDSKGHFPQYTSNIINNNGGFQLSSQRGKLLKN